MSLHRALVFTLIGIVLLAAILVVLMIWGVILDASFFYKLIGTLVVAALVIGFLLVIKSDFGEHKRLKDENFID